ncbi:hypothetical protein E2562_012410 [Oryza meyeriana var. granulata]|uniref:Uncharacterized protein n=1 Tax=Oryza meyeriana var. granulata TaxID=110450 RepID=A0A6G1C5E2_9ORYZ|nr:hypothetical protein E2562_012410 [Oryza meyeriana var. granulata]
MRDHWPSSGAVVHLRRRRGQRRLDRRRRRWEESALIDGCYIVLLLLNYGLRIVTVPVVLSDRTAVASLEGAALCQLGLPASADRREGAPDDVADALGDEAAVDLAVDGAG